MTEPLQNSDWIRQVFRWVNKAMVWMFQLGTGPYLFPNPWSGRIMVLTHTGRKSQQPRRTPVNYAILDGEIYCMAGFGAQSDWYRNVKINPLVEVWLPEGWWEGATEDVSDDPRRAEIIYKVALNSGFAAPAAGVDPRKLTPAQVAEVAASYRLVKIHRIVPRTGPGGPGEFAWVWQVLSFVLAALLLLRPRGRRRQ